MGLSNDRIPLDVNNDIIYKEAQVNGVTGRLMYKTWYDCERLLKTGRIDVQSTSAAGIGCRILTAPLRRSRLARRAKCS